MINYITDPKMVTSSHLKSKPVASKPVASKPVASKLSLQFSTWYLYKRIFITRTYIN